MVCPNRGQRTNTQSDLVGQGTGIFQLSVLVRGRGEGVVGRHKTYVLHTHELQWSCNDERL